MNRFRRLALLWALVSTFFIAVPIFGQNTAANTETSTKASTSSKPSAQEIADAKSKGLVWVNLSTRVYHKDGAFYGNTKRGKFMTEDEAVKAGYRAAKERGSKKKTPTK